MKQIINPCNLCLPKKLTFKILFKGISGAKISQRWADTAYAECCWSLGLNLPQTISCVSFPPPCFPVCFRCFPINKGRMPEMNVKKDNSETQIMVLVTITTSVIFLQISSKQTASLCYFMYANLIWPQHKKLWLKQIQMQSSEGKPWVVDFNVIFTLKHTTHLKLFGNQGSTHKTAFPARILRNDLRRVKGTDPNITEQPNYTSEQACPMDTLPTALKVSASNILFPR